MQRLLTRVEPQENDDLLRFSFSSEYPVDRMQGDEVLDHTPGAVRLDRLNEGAPVLWNHNADQLVGVVERAYLVNKRGYAEARYSSSDFAQQIKRDVEAGIIRNVSVGYRILRMGDHKKGETEYRVAEWEPYEVSLVSIPADPTVGVGRTNQIQQEEKMTEPTLFAAAADDEKIRQERNAAVNAERDRVRTINAYAAQFNKPQLGETLITSGKSIDEARAIFLDEIAKTQQPINRGSGDVDMDKTEQRRYSLMKAIRASATGKWDEAGLEREVSLALEKKLGKPTQGFYLPHNLMVETRATYAVGSASTGGALVDTSIVPESFIEILRNNAVIAQLGPTVLTGLVGNLNVPRQATAATAYWVAEAAAPTQTEATFDYMSLNPKQVAARSKISRLMLQQATPDIEQIVRNDLNAVLALAIDKAAIYGTGSSNEPQGILNTPGVPTNVTTSTNFDCFIDLEKEVDTDNALLGNLYYLTTPQAVAKLKKLKESSSSSMPLWSNNLLDTTRLPNPRAEMIINGYPMLRTLQMPRNGQWLTSSNQSSILFGNFNDVVMAMWGGLEIVANSLGDGFNSGSVDVRAIQTIDIGVRRTESFAAVRDFAE